MSTSTTNSSSTTAAERPKLGIGVFVIRPNPTSPQSHPQFILGERLGSHGAGTWALPGGHLEFSESFEECAAREVEEETGLTVTNIRFLTATNDVMTSENKHYVTVFVTAEVDGENREPQVLEPNKCAGWEWVEWEEMVGWVERQGKEGARRLFLPMINLVKQRPGVVPSLI